MSNLTEHFSFDELTSTDHSDLVESNRHEAKQYEDKLKVLCERFLEPVRAIFGRPVYVNSGYRGTELNRRVGGSQTSQHCKAEAVDLVVKGMDDYNGRVEVVRALVYYLRGSGLTWGQILLERGCVHVSVGERCQVANAVHEDDRWVKKEITELSRYVQTG